MRKRSAAIHLCMVLKTVMKDTFFGCSSRHCIPVRVTLRMLSYASSKVSKGGLPLRCTGKDRSTSMRSIVLNRLNAIRKFYCRIYIFETDS